MVCLFFLSNKLQVIFFLRRAGDEIYPLPFNETSIELAEERGPFSAGEGSTYDLCSTPLQPLTRFENNWNRPEVSGKRKSK